MKSRLEEIATRQGMSIYRLAKKSGLRYNTVYSIWHERQWPREETLQKLAEALNVSAAELVTPDENTTSRY